MTGTRGVSFVGRESFARTFGVSNLRGDRKGVVNFLCCRLWDAWVGRMGLGGLGGEDIAFAGPAGSSEKQIGPGTLKCLISQSGAVDSSSLWTGASSRTKHSVIIGSSWGIGCLIVTRGPLVILSSRSNRQSIGGGEDGGLNRYPERGEDEKSFPGLDGCGDDLSGEEGMQGSSAHRPFVNSGESGTPPGSGEVRPEFRGCSCDSRISDT